MEAEVRAGGTDAGDRSTQLAVRGRPEAAGVPDGPGLTAATRRATRATAAGAVHRGASRRGRTIAVDLGTPEVPARVATAATSWASFAMSAPREAWAEPSGRRRPPGHSAPVPPGYESTALRGILAIDEPWERGRGLNSSRCACISL